MTPKIKLGPLLHQQFSKITYCNSKTCEWVFGYPSRLIAEFCDACAETQKRLSLGKVWTHLGFKKIQSFHRGVPRTKKQQDQQNTKSMEFEGYCEVDEMHIYIYTYQKSGWKLWFHLTCMFQVFCENSVPTPTPPVTSRVAIPSELGESEGWKKVKHIPQMAVINGDLPWYKVNKSPWTNKGFIVQSKNVNMTTSFYNKSVDTCDEKWNPFFISNIAECNLWTIHEPPRKKPN